MFYSNYEFFSTSNYSFFDVCFSNLWIIFYFSFNTFSSSFSSSEIIIPSYSFRVLDLAFSSMSAASYLSYWWARSSFSWLRTSTFCCTTSLSLCWFLVSSSIIFISKSLFFWSISSSFSYNFPIFSESYWVFSAKRFLICCSSRFRRSFSVSMNSLLYPPERRLTLVYLVDRCGLSFSFVLVIFVICFEYSSGLL